MDSGSALVRAGQVFNLESVERLRLEHLRLGGHGAMATTFSSSFLKEALEESIKGYCSSGTRAEMLECYQDRVERCQGMSGCEGWAPGLALNIQCRQWQQCNLCFPIELARLVARSVYNE
jgi:hypothetical protein